MNENKELLKLVIFAMKQSLANIRCDERTLKISYQQIQEIISEIYNDLLNSSSKTR